MKIPRYDSRQEPTTQPAGVERQPSQVGQAISQLGKIGMNIASKVADAENSRLTAMQEDKIYQSVNEVKEEARQDTNMDGEWEKRYSEKLQSRVQGVVESAPKRIKGDVAAYARKELLKARAALAKEHNKKAKENWDIIKERKKDAAEEKWLTADTQPARDEALMELRDFFTKGVEVGHEYKAGAQQELEDFHERIRKSLIDRDKHADPAGFVERVLSGVHPYTFKNNEEKNEMVDSARKEAAKKKKAAELLDVIEQDKTEQDKVDAVLSGEETPLDIKRARVLGEQGMSGGIGKDFSKVAIDYLEAKETVDPKNIAKTVGKLSQQFSALGISRWDETEVSIKKIAKFRQDVMTAMAIGTLKEGTGREYLKNTAIPWNTKLEEKAINQYKKVAKGLNALNAWQSVTGRNISPPENLDEIKAELSTRLLELAREEDLTKLSDEELYGEVDRLIRETIKENNPDIATKEGVPNGIVSEDGEYQEWYDGENLTPEDEEVQEDAGELDEYGYYLGEQYMLDDVLYEYIGNGQGRPIRRD